MKRRDYISTILAAKTSITVTEEIFGALNADKKIVAEVYQKDCC
jgi:hypothetical protein